MKPAAVLSTSWQVPEYRLETFAPRRAEYCICVFVINEGERIRQQLQRMRNLADSLDILVADGGSSDGSLEPGYLQSQNVRALLTKTGPGRLSAQMRMALAYAMEESYAGVITIDGNNKDNPGAACLFVQALQSGCDHIQGSRYIPGGKGINTPFSRHWGVRLLHAPLISLAAGFHYTDTTNGFRAYSRRLLLDLRVAPFRDVFSSYELHYYLAIRAARLGYCVREVPVERAYPPHGKTPTKISPLRGNLLILRTLFKAVTGQYNP